MLVKRSPVLTYSPDWKVWVDAANENNDLWVCAKFIKRETRDINHGSKIQIVATEHQGNWSRDPDSFLLEQIGTGCDLCNRFDDDGDSIWYLHLEEWETEIKVPLYTAFARFLNDFAFKESDVEITFDVIHG